MSLFESLKKRGPILIFLSLFTLHVEAREQSASCAFLIENLISDPKGWRANILGAWRKFDSKQNAVASSSVNRLIDGTLTEAERILLVELVVGRRLTSEETASFIDIHNLGEGFEHLGHYSLRTLKSKRARLIQELALDGERANLILRLGLAGTVPVYPPSPYRQVGLYRPLPVGDGLSRGQAGVLDRWSIEASNTGMGSPKVGQSSSSRASNSGTFGIDDLLESIEHRRIIKKHLDWSQGPDRTDWQKQISMRADEVWSSQRDHFLEKYKGSTKVEKIFSSPEAQIFFTDFYLVSYEQYLIEAARVNGFDDFALQRDVETFLTKLIEQDWN